MKRGGDPIIVALDTGDRVRMSYLARVLKGRVKRVKVGLEAYTRLGPELMDELREEGYGVFADLKLHDIPNTVKGAVGGLVRRGVEMLTLHLSGGTDMVEAAVRAAREEAAACGTDPPALLGVTVLTSLDEDSLEEMGWTGGVRRTVLSLARLGCAHGVDGVVASPWEAEMLRKALGLGPLIVTPGIRLPGSHAYDQARFFTPSRALAAGADYIVIGREITASGDPERALAGIREEAGLPAM